MKLAIYGRSFSEEVRPFIQDLFHRLDRPDIELWICRSYLKYLKEAILLPADLKTFSYGEIQENQVDCLISIGGDGTFLESALQVRDTGVPILGINTGRLGFLASIAKEEIDAALDLVLAGDYTLEQRTVLQIEQPPELFKKQPFALNELTVHKKDSSSMITIRTFLDGQFLNAYWADGLIVATPTGSTAYSLSCGGPIIMPNVSGLIITPIAPHNLNVRPMVVPDSSTITLQVEGRGAQFLASLDSRSETINSSFELVVRKADFGINLITLPNESFLNTMRMKLMWGLDRRN